ncbi:MAG TPA: hypothetical protein VKD69_18490 [Vicinamibacterales bacterium]|nr:hypothetical protein [Vicinamibacterales bacterium]
MTVYACPAIVTRPARVAPVFGATAIVTVPFPSPVCPDATVSQAAPLVALHRQPESVATLTFNRPPVSPIVSSLRDKEKMHGAACWLTEILLPETVIDAERGDGTGFAVTEYATLPSP